MFGLRKGMLTMCENDLELIRIIRDAKDPTKAILKATDIIHHFLKQHEASLKASAGHPLEHD